MAAQLPVSQVGKVMAFYHQATAGQCCGASDLQFVRAAKPGQAKEFEALIERLISVIYAGQSDEVGLLDLPLFELINEQLQEAIEVAWQSTDERLRSFLSRNVQKFSGFKTYQLQKAITEKLYDAAGKIRSFLEFKADALQLHQLYNVHYLKTEYNHAVASAQMASKWSQFEPGALLKFSTVGDDRVRPSHHRLEGITLPATHEFWRKYYPPLEWNCRCTVVELSEDEEAHTPADELQGLPDIDGLFANNAALEKELFAPEHPYFDVPEKVAKQISKQLKLEL